MPSKRGLVTGVISALFVGGLALLVHSAAVENSITSQSGACAPSRTSPSSSSGRLTSTAMRFMPSRRD